MAGTITGTIERITTQEGRPKLVVIKLTCTAEVGAATYPATVVNDLAGVSDYDLRGLKLYSVATVPGTPGPTDNTDLTITDRYGIDILAGSGANIIDNTALNRLVIGIASGVIITGDITVNISANAVNAATFDIILELIGL